MSLKEFSSCLKYDSTPSFLISWLWSIMQKIYSYDNATMSLILSPHLHSSPEEPFPSTEPQPQDDMIDNHKPWLFESILSDKRDILTCSKTLYYSPERTLRVNFINENNIYTVYHIIIKIFSRDLTWKAWLAKPKPSCLQTTMASMVPQLSLHTVPHTREPFFSARTSTRPS